eukprot:g1590.t1
MTSERGRVEHQEEQQKTPVLIAGAGPVGTFTALLLAKFGVPSIRVDPFARGGVDREKTSKRRKGSLGESASAFRASHPRAHVLNVRTMEILREMGLAAAVANTMPHEREWRQFRYCTSLLGRTLCSVDHMDNVDGKIGNIKEHSPEGPAHLSQPILERILREEIERGEYADLAEVMYGYELVDFEYEYDDSAVHVRLRSIDTGKLSRVLCSQLLGADGAHSVVREGANIDQQGTRRLESFMSVHFTCEELWSAMRQSDPESAAMLSFVMNEDVLACLVAHDVGRGEWVAQLPMYSSLPYSRGAVRRLLSSCVWGARNGEKAGVASPNPVDLKIRSAQPWSMNAVVANRFSKGRRIHLVGDAACSLPPSGGFGLNTGLQSAHNLAWKIACVHHGDAPLGLLDSYDSERRPVSISNAAVSVENYYRGLKVPAAIGLRRDVLSSAVEFMNSDAARAFLPFDWMRRGVLEGGVSAGLRGVGSLFLGNGAPLAGTAVSRIEDVVVRNREALPLLFPRNDIGFAYERSGIVGDVSKTSAWGRKEKRRRESRERRLVFGESDHSAQRVSSSSGAFLGDELYVADERPGSRLPHEWVIGDGGDERVVHSTLDIVARLFRDETRTEVSPTRPCFVLLSYTRCVDGADTIVARKIGHDRDVAESESITFHVLSPQYAKGDMRNEREFRAENSKDATTAVAARRRRQYHLLVRPDGHIAWRCDGTVDGEAGLGGGGASCCGAVQSKGRGGVTQRGRAWGQRGNYREYAPTQSGPVGSDCHHSTTGTPALPPPARARAGHSSAACTREDTPRRCL